MIKQTTVLMATPIAMLATAKGIDLHERAGDIIKGLNETTAAPSAYTEDNIAVDLPAFTAKSVEHTEAMEVVTEMAAARIRQGLEVISKRVKPVLKRIEMEIQNELSAASVVDTIFGACRVTAVNIEPSFLKSPFYPKSVPANFDGINTVKTSDLLKGVYPSMTGEALVELIAVPVPELQTFFSNPAEVKRVYDSLFVENYYYEVVSSAAIDNGIININSGNNFQFGNFRPMVIASLIINKLVSMEDPIEGLTGVNLDDYRASLAVTRDLLSTMLFRFAQIWETRAAAGVVILDEGVKLGKQLGAMQLLEGTLTIGYNSAVMEMFADAESLSLSEFGIGYCYAKQRGYNPKDIITDRDAICDAFREYCGDVKMAIITDKSKLAAGAYSRVLESLYTKEEFKDAIDAMNDAIIPSQRLQQRVAVHIDIGAFFQNVTLIDQIIKNENSLMNTHLAAVLAGAFDSPIAEEILRINAQNKPGSIEQQRKALSCAITTVILKRLIK